jgi:diacylglycerol O-acyltransferase / wax synthase
MSHFLDPLDSAFVLLEVAGSAMNIGAVIELGPGEPTDPGKRFELIRDNIADRIHEIPIFTQRIVRAPFDMTWPILVPEERFDIDRHVVRVALPAPGTPDQFDALVSEFFSRPLIPNRPLWQLLVIEGLAGGQAAIALKVHHALADGVSGAEAFANLFDISPEVRPPAIKTEPVTNGEIVVTSSMGLLRQGLLKIKQNPQLIVESVGSWIYRIYETLRAVARVAMVHGRRQSNPDQPSIFEARRTSLNGAPGVEKSFHRLRVPLADVKRAAKSRGASVTDFVMATSSGALRRLLDDRGETLRKDLVAFVPINVREAGASSDVGNQISGMLVRLHTDIADPEDRLVAIAKDSRSTATSQREHNAKILQNIPRVLGPMALSFGGKIISAFELINRIPPIANLMVSSVPGPPIPLWLSGYHVDSAAPVGPLIGSFSLNITVLGFGQYLEFGLLGCADQMTDLAKLRDYIHDEANLLIDATKN